MSGPCGGSGPPGGWVGGPPPWVVWFRGWGGGGAVGCRWVLRSGAGCLLWSELYRGFDGEPTGKADLFRVETRTYTARFWP